MKIGLVLCGGGAKGAYQIGCWKALKEAGMDKFVVVSGTSVGALNGALIAMGDYQQAEKIWMELTEKHVLLTTETRKFFVKFVFGVMLILGTIFYHIGVLVRTALLLVPAALWTSSVIWFKFLTTREMKPIFGGPLETWLQNVVIFGGALFIWYATYLFVKDNAPSVGIAFVRTFIRKLAVLLGRWLPIGVNYPLLNLIKSNLNTKQLRESDVTLYCTVSVATKYRDPYRVRMRETNESMERRRRYWQEAEINPQWHIQHPTSRPPEPTPRREVDLGAIPEAVSGWLPHVINVTALESDEEIFSAILQSANLPLVFERGTWLGKTAIDGGVSDNVPIIPALHAGCTLVIVVYLKHLMRPTLQQVITDLKARHKWDMCRELSSGQAMKAYKAYCEDPKQPDLPFEINDTQFLFVVPSRSLGRTTDFRGGTRAGSLIDLGYEDMKAALAAHFKGLGAGAVSTSVTPGKPKNQRMCSDSNAGHRRRGRE